MMFKWIKLNKLFFVFVCSSRTDSARGVLEKTFQFRVVKMRNVCSFTELKHTSDSANFVCYYAKCGHLLLSETVDDRAQSFSYNINTIRRSLEDVSVAKLFKTIGAREVLSGIIQRFERKRDKVVPTSFA